MLLLFLFFCFAPFITVVDAIPSVENVRISEYPGNLSDHLPIEIDLRINLAFYNGTKQSFPRTINWNNVKDENLNKYSN